MLGNPSRVYSLAAKGNKGGLLLGLVMGRLDVDIALAINADVNLLH